MIQKNYMKKKKQENFKLEMLKRIFQNIWVDQIGFQDISKSIDRSKYFNYILIKSNDAIRELRPAIWDGTSHNVT